MEANKRKGNDTYHNNTYRKNTDGSLAFRIPREQLAMGAMKNYRDTIRMGVFLAVILDIVWLALVWIPMSFTISEGGLSFHPTNLLSTLAFLILTPFLLGVLLAWIGRSTCHRYIPCIPENVVIRENALEIDGETFTADQVEKLLMTSPQYEEGKKLPKELQGKYRKLILTGANRNKCWEFDARKTDLQLGAFPGYEEMARELSRWGERNNTPVSLG